MSDLPPIPWADVADRRPPPATRPGLVVDLRRCIGCHACSVACKTEHSVPLGTFRMRVRWLPRPDRPTMAFVPLFDGELCDLGAGRAQVGLPPACVAACPTTALIHGDLGDPDSTVSRAAVALDAQPLRAPEADLRADVLYAGHEPWQGHAVHRGCPLDPRDQDIIYEQR